MIHSRGSLLLKGDMSGSSIALWRVNDGQLKRVSAEDVDRERRLEDWIESHPDILGERLLLIGRQVRTEYGGIIDLLALDGEGRVVVVELKRGRTPREIVAQALDYESWVAELPEQTIRDFVTLRTSLSFDDAFRRHFGTSVPERINEEQRVLIVSTGTDEATRRIVQRLTSRYGVDINVVTLSYYRLGEHELLARMWEIDPAELGERIDSHHATPKSDEPGAWTGLWHVNVGVHDNEPINRNWSDPRKYGFLSGGQGAKWRDEMLRLNVGDKVYAYLNGAGYVGGGRVISRAVKAAQFVPPGQDKSLTELPLESSEWLHNGDDDEMADFMVGVKWNRTVDASEGVRVTPTLRGTVKKIWSPNLAKTLIANFGE